MARLTSAALWRHAAHSGKRSRTRGCDRGPARWRCTRGLSCGGESKLLFKEDIHSRARVQHGKCALAKAGSAGHLEAVQLLLQRGADVNKVTEHVRFVVSMYSVPIHTLRGEQYGESALMFACQGGHLEVIQALAGAGADVNLRAKEVLAVGAPCFTVKIVLQDGSTALMWAADAEYIEAMRFLMDAGALPDTQDKVSIRLRVYWGSGRNMCSMDVRHYTGQAGRATCSPSRSCSAEVPIRRSSPRHGSMFLVVNTLCVRVRLLAAGWYDGPGRRSRRGNHGSGGGPCPQWGRRVLAGAHENFCAIVLALS
jgi:hypothetical protein